jgi:hypothetical protein
MDPSPKTASLRYGWLVLAIALVIGIVGANALTDAAGFHGQREPMQFVCGIVLFFLTWMGLRFLFQLGTLIVLRLGQVRERPALPITITLLACGTLCVLGALLVVWHGDTGVLNMSPAVNLPGNMPGSDMVSHLDLSMRTTGSLIWPMTVCAALVIGVALLALGVWSSLAPPPANITPNNVPESPSTPAASS